MKFLVYSHTGSFYGAPKSVLELTDPLKGNGHEFIYILPEKGPFYDELKEKNYDVNFLPNPAWVCAPRAKGYPRFYYFKHRVKLIFFFFWEIVSGYLKSKKFLQEINPDWVIVNTSVAPLGILLASYLRIKCIIMVREPILNKVGWKIPGLFPRSWMSFVFKKSTIVIGPSNFIINHFKERFRIYNGVVLRDPVQTETDFRNNFVVQNIQKRFGLVGTISERKGQVEFVEALLRSSTHDQVFIFGDGSGSYFQLLEKLRIKNPNQVFIFPFQINIRKIYEAFDIYVNMGVDETFGRTTVEAMRFGKLVFGRNSGATPELIDPGVNGFLFNEPQEVFEILDEYLAENKKEELIEISRRGYLSSLNFLPEKIADEFLAILDNFDRS